MFSSDQPQDKDLHDRAFHLLSEPLFTPEEVAAALSAKRPTILKWAREGRLPSIQLPNNDRRFTRRHVEDFLAGC